MQIVLPAALTAIVLVTDRMCTGTSTSRSQSTAPISSIVLSTRFTGEELLRSVGSSSATLKLQYSLELVKLVVQLLEHNVFFC